VRQGTDDRANPGEDHEDDRPRAELGEVAVEAERRDGAHGGEEVDNTEGDPERAPQGVEDGGKNVAGREALDTGDELGDATPHEDEGEEQCRAVIQSVSEVRRRMTEGEQKTTYEPCHHPAIQEETIQVLPARPARPNASGGAIG
jgi:hypothetical protein